MFCDELRDSAPGIDVNQMNCFSLISINGFELESHNMDVRPDVSLQFRRLLIVLNRITNNLNYAIIFLYKMTYAVRIARGGHKNLLIFHMREIGIQAYALNNPPAVKIFIKLPKIINISYDLQNGIY